MPVYKHWMKLVAVAVAVVTVLTTGSLVLSQDKHEVAGIRATGSPWDCVVNTTGKPLLVSITTGTTGTGPYILPVDYKLSFGYQSANKKAVVVAYEYNTNTLTTAIEFDLVNQSTTPTACFPISKTTSKMRREEIKEYSTKGEVMAP